MRKIGVFVAVALALPASANVSRAQRMTEATLWSVGAVNGSVALAAGVGLGGYKVSPARSIKLKRAMIRVTGAGGGGAGSTVFTVTDGTNTCTFSFACTVTNATGVFDAAATDGAGTGCTYVASFAAVVASVTTGSCTTTQPSVSSVVFTEAP